MGRQVRCGGRRGEGDRGGLGGGGASRYPSLWKARHRPLCLGVAEGGVGAGGGRRGGRRGATVTRPPSQLTLTLP